MDTTISRQSLGYYSLWLLVPFSLAGCIEPFEIETATVDSSLVVEATITDEIKNQEIRLSRTFALDTTGIFAETGAKVQVLESSGTVHEFSEGQPGIYSSTIPFAAREGVGYSLFLATKEGDKYSSLEVISPPPTEIENIYAERDFKDGDANEGMFIYVDCNDSTGGNLYYRYQYEETYKIIAPFWETKETYVISNDPLTIGVRIREQEERVCYSTERSTEILQASTGRFGVDRISKYPVRFIDRDNFMLSHRYSILVRQYLQSRGSYTYYQTLEELSSNGSLFSQIQTGFLEGNISAEITQDEKVIGFFDVSSVSSKRLFFNYQDFFKGEPLPSFVSDCPFLSPGNWDQAVQTEELRYWDENNGQYGLFKDYSPYIFVYPVCGDCTVLGSNVVPEFWEEG